MARKPDIAALVRELLGEGTDLGDVALRTETAGMLRLSEIAALSVARSLREISGGEKVPRAWLVSFVRRVLPALKEGYENCGEDPESIWAGPYMEAKAIAAELGEQEEDGGDGQPES